MTQPNKILRASIINGACLVLIIVGFALVTNKLLDKFSLADEAGLTIDQRKEKARRNQASFDHPKPKSDGWKLSRWIPSFSFGVPDCDSSEAGEQLKVALAVTIGAVRLQGDRNCLGGCVPFFDGGKLQFYTLEYQGPNQQLRRIRTFDIPTSDFLNAIEMGMTNVRIVEKDRDANAVRCLAHISTRIDLSGFDPEFLSREVINFKNFDGRAPIPWSGQRQYKTTIGKELQMLYRPLTWNAPLGYIVQKSTDGRINVQLE